MGKIASAETKHKLSVEPCYTLTLHLSVLLFFFTETVDEFNFGYSGTTRAPATYVPSYHGKSTLQLYSGWLGKNVQEFTSVTYQWLPGGGSPSSMEAWMWLDIWETHGGWTRYNLFVYKVHNFTHDEHFYVILYMLYVSVWLTSPFYEFAKDQTFISWKVKIP